MRPALALVPRQPEARAHEALSAWRREHRRCRWVSRGVERMPIRLAPPRAVRPNGVISHRPLVVRDADFEELRVVIADHDELPERVVRQGKRWFTASGEHRRRIDAIAAVLANYRWRGVVVAPAVDRSDVPAEPVDPRMLARWAAQGWYPVVVDAPYFVGWCSLAAYGDGDGCSWCERIDLVRGRPRRWRR